MDIYSIIYANQANAPLSLRHYTYCANNPLRYTDPNGHFFGALFHFVTGAVVGTVTEYVTQKFIEKHDKINVKAIVYEGMVGGVTSIIGGGGELDDTFGSKKQLSATNRKKASQATGLIDDAADATPRPRTNALPDVEMAPSRGAVKNAEGGLAMLV